MKKMKSMFRLFVTLMLLGGWALAASALHVVWTGSKAVIIPKNRIAVRETYVNAATWSADDVAAHPTLAKRLVDTGHTEVLAAAFKDVSATDLPAKIDEAIAHGPTTKPADVVADRLDKVVEKTQHAVDKVKTTIER
jgi:hypothetical protein